MSKNVGDLNLKLKMEIGALRSENEGLVRKNEEIRAQVTDIETKIQVSFCGFRCGLPGPVVGIYKRKQETKKTRKQKNKKTKTRPRK